MVEAENKKQEASPKPEGGVKREREEDDQGDAERKLKKVDTKDDVDQEDGGVKLDAVAA